MPTYEYKCKKCLLRFELKRRFSENGGAFCPQCGSEARRIFTPAPIIFKGSGFYVTDNKGSSEHLKTAKADGDKDNKQKTD